MVCTTHKNGKTMGMVDPIGLRTLTCASQVYLASVPWYSLWFTRWTWNPFERGHDKHSLTMRPWGTSFARATHARKHTCITCCNPSKTVKFHLTLNFARSYWLGALPQHPQPSTKRSLLCSRTLRTKPWRNLENHGSCDHVGIMAAVGRKPWATCHGAS